MVGPRQRPGGALGLLQLTLLLCLLYPPIRALPWVSGDARPPPQSFEVVKGTFSRHFLSVGYHQIVEIPAGAQNITIQEITKSRNYLALQTRGGVSIINGHWGIDRPGVFIAVGTQLTYRRPNEIRSRIGESIVAPGPITEDLHLYLIYQQPDPSVYYEYSVPLYNTTPSPAPQIPPDVLSLVETDDPVSPHKDSIIQDISSNEILKDTPNPEQSVPEPEGTPDPLPAYIWSQAGHTGCSATCGAGRREALWRCVETESLLSASVDLCDLALRPPTPGEDCVTRPCPAHWDLGEWSECSRRCGPGTQHRQVLCRQVTPGNGTETGVPVGAELCGASERPVTKASCQIKICSQWRIRSEWSPCSVPCGVGQRSRAVVCVGDGGEVEEDSECNRAVKPPALENCDAGVCTRGWFTSPWSRRCSAECGEGLQTRTARCLMDHVTSLPLDGCDGARPSEETSCNLGPCDRRVEWYSGPWGQCSAECGNGTQTRSVACLLNSNGSLEVVAQLKCSHLPRPISSQPCLLEPCGGRWYATEWSACSASCGGGYRVREARCLADRVAPDDHCDPATAPEGREECNTQRCVTETDPSCRDQYPNCAVVVQARLCVYPYYRGACCASCSSAPRPYAHSYVRKNLRR